MSALAGIVDFDGRPVDEGCLGRMIGALAGRGDDSVRVAMLGSAGLAFRTRWTTAEERGRPQPIAGQDGRLLAVFDGRLDNRGELLAALATGGFGQPALREPAGTCGLAPADQGLALTDRGPTLRAAASGGGASDAELVLGAYRRWGADAAAHLLGDFAFAVWDAAERTLVCARDVFGVRPLFYCRGPSFLVFASEPHALFHDPRVPSRPNEAMAGEILAGAVSSITDTLWQDVLRVAPACWVRFSARGDTSRRYWDIDPMGGARARNPERSPGDHDGGWGLDGQDARGDPGGRAADPRPGGPGEDDDERERDAGRGLGGRDWREWADELRDLLRESVGARLRADGPVATDLSGGLDSATITALACERRTAGPGAADCGDAYSLIFPGMACDERARIGATAHHLGVRVTECLPELPEPEFFHEQVRRYRDLPSYPNGAPMHGPAWRAAARAGYRVVLSGVGGDQWFEGSPDEVADLLRAGRWRDALRQARLGSGRSAPPVLWRHGLRPLVPAWARRVRRRLQPSRGRGAVSAAFARRIGLTDRLAAPQRAADRLPASLRAVASVVADGWQSHACEAIDRDSSAAGLEYRHPFLDRRLAEFAAAVPGEFVFRDGYTKWILRQAMRDHLPPALLASRAKPDFDEFCNRVIVSVARSLPDPGARLVALGWVDPARLPRLQRLPDGTLAFDAPRPLTMYQKWAVLSLDLWGGQV